MLADCAPSGPSAPTMTRPQSVEFPSAPNTNDEPTPEKPSSFVMYAPSVVNVRCPAAVLRTTTANATCSPRPHATVLQRIARRFVENATAIVRITTAPNKGCSTPNISAPRQQSTADGRAACL